VPDRSAWSDVVLVALLVVISVQNLMAINAIVPSIPAISAELGVSFAAAKLVLPTFFAPYALSFILYGPLSDRHGRRPVLLASLAIYSVGSLLCTAAHSIDLLIAGRILQGAGAGGGSVIALAVARDKFEGEKFLKVVSYINVGRSLIPAIAPAMGGVALDVFGHWQAPFAFVATFALLLYILSQVAFEETNNQKLTRGLSAIELLLTYKPMLMSSEFVGNALAGAFSFGAWFAYVTASPAVFIVGFGVSPSEYGIYHALTVGGCIVGGLATARLSGRVPTSIIATSGLTLLVLGSLVLLVGSIVAEISLYSVLIPMIVVAFGYGIVFSATSASAMKLFRDRAGSAFASIGFMCMSIATVGTTLVSFSPGDPVVAFSLAMTAMAISSAAFGTYAIMAARRTACMPGADAT
jgi:DHA1 family bicyclomycin/chloramphenicol resistance-like MFS transporter